MKNMLLFRFELKKAGTNRVSICLCSLCLLGVIAMIVWLGLEGPDPIYQMYMKTLSGPFTPEKESYILNERNTIDHILFQYDQVHTDYQNKKIDKQTLREYNRQYYEARDKKPSFDKVFQRYEYFKQIEQEKERLLLQQEQASAQGDLKQKQFCIQLLKSFEKEPEFFDETGWHLLFSDSSSYLVLIIIFLWTANCYSIESRSGVARFHDISLKKNQVYWCKLALALLGAILLTTVIQVVRIIFIQLQFGLPFADASLQSIPEFGCFASPVTLSQAFAKSIVLQILGTCILVLVLSCFFATKKNILIVSFFFAVWILFRFCYVIFFSMSVSPVISYLLLNPVSSLKNDIIWSTGSFSISSELLGLSGYLVISVLVLLKMKSKLLR